MARPDVSCSFCMQPFDCYGDHAACCKKNSDIIVRHNRLRNLVARFAEEGLLSPVLEKRFLCGPTSGRRPGDVTIPCWRDSKGLAVDVAVTSTFSQRNLTLENPANAYGLKKHGKYDSGFVGTAYLFCAVVLETTGGLQRGGRVLFPPAFPLCSPPAEHQALCTLAGLGLVWLVTCRPLLHRPSCIALLPGVSQFVVTSRKGRPWSLAAVGRRRTQREGKWRRAQRKWRRAQRK